MTISQAIVAINTHLLWLPKCEKALRTAQLLIAARDTLQRQRDALRLLEDKIDGDYMLLKQDGAWHLVDEDAESVVASDSIEQLLDALYELEHPKAGGNP